MKKFNWKLLLVLALALVLVISLFACNPKEDNKPNEENPPGPQPGPGEEIEESDFFNELYAVGGGIGQQKVEAGKDVYLEAELGLALGTRANGKAATSPIEVGIALKALLDRQTPEHKGSAIAVDLTVGKAQALSLYFKLSDDCVYVVLGNQKVKINTKLIPIGDMLGGLLNTKFGGETGKSVPDYLGEVADLTGDEFELDTLVGYIFETFGLQEWLEGEDSGMVGTVLGAFIDEETELFSVEKLLESDLIQTVLSATKTDLGGNVTRYEAALGEGDVMGIDLQETIAGFLGAGSGVGSLGVKVSFDADNNHKLQEGGVKISADFKVDPQNELYASLPGEGADKEFPFAEISIKHLNIQDGTGKSALVNVADYKDNLQLDVKEEIEIKGIKIGGRAGTKLPRHIELRVLANLDLANEKNNATKLYLDLSQTIEEALQEVVNTTSDPLTGNKVTEYKPELKEVKESILNFTLADGRLTHTFNPSAYLVPGYFAWQGILHNPIRDLIYNAIDGVNHEQAETFKSRYDHQYAATVMTQEYDFKGMVIDNLDMTEVINLVKGLFTPATSSEEGDPAPTEGVKEKNMYNGIIKAFTFLNSKGDGKFGIGLHGLLDDGAELLQYFGLSSIGTGEDAVPLTKAGLFPFLKDAVEGFMSMLTSDGLLTLDGCTEDKAYEGGTFIQKLNFLFAGEKDTEGQVTFDFDFTNGLNWELYWLAQDNEEKAPVFEDVVEKEGMEVEGVYYRREESKNKVTDKGVEDVSIRYKSTIKINETPETIATDPFTEMFAAKKTYDDGIAAAQQAVTKAHSDAEANNTAFAKATENYHNSAEYKAYVDAQGKYTEAKKAASDLINQYKTVPGVSAANVSGYYSKSLGLNVSKIYSQNSSSNTSKPLYLWVKNGKKTDGSDENYKTIKDFIEAATAAVDTYKDKLGDSYESWKKAWDMNGQNNLWTAYLAECEALIKQNDTKAAAEDKEKVPTYKEYLDAQANKKTTDAAITTAEKAVKALEDPYFVYFYMDLAEY